MDPSTLHEITEKPNLNHSASLGIAIDHFYMITTDNFMTQLSAYVTGLYFVGSTGCLNLKLTALL